MKGKDQFVGPHRGGGWQVKGAGNARATAVTKTQHEAIGRAKEIAVRQKSEVAIQGRDGRIREKNSYGNDPHPPEG